MNFRVPPNVGLLVLLCLLSPVSTSIATELVGAALQTVRHGPSSSGHSSRKGWSLNQRVSTASTSQELASVEKADVTRNLSHETQLPGNPVVEAAVQSSSWSSDLAAAPRVLTVSSESAKSEFRGPAAVTVFYFLLYYAFMILQLQTRGAAAARAEASGRGFDRFSTRDPEAIMGERTFLNTLEQMGPFLAALWSCAALVSCTLATWLGAIAVLSRLFFPIFWSMGEGGQWNILVEASTQPYYLCLMGMFGAVATWAFCGVNIVDDYSGWIVAVLVVAYYVAFFVISFALGKGVHLVTTGKYTEDLS
eukprot:gnl/MRDRNA2_/MRDRNA2_139564_c0_seq1.p1 gnl/MRDRNA2_/MRDRNA2_139564_c0~~gnl/MRDRNA2_/MRDRNA2_139564_c0_seq1.p1  ORF type:complete len:307 (-),score=47.53 gnl/MRDRNA2_/MRDRNA2_139564_c0_seq1:215-1135(-)